MRKIILFLLLSVLFIDSLEAATRYAHPTGSGTACTEITTPCSLDTALSQMQPSDVLQMRGGTYPRTTTILNPLPSGTSCQAPTIMESYPGELAVITRWVGTGDTINNNQARDNITFRNFEIDGSNGLFESTGIRTSSYYVFRCLTIEGMNIHSQQADSVAMGDLVDGAIVRNNKFWNNRYVPPDPNIANGQGLLYIRSKNSLYEGNELWTSPGGAITIRSTLGGATGNTLRKNIIRGVCLANDIGCRGINISNNDNRLVENTIFRVAEGYSAGNRSGIYNYGAANTLIWNNTIYANAGACISLHVNSSYVTAKNNLCVDNSSGIVNPSSNNITLSNNVVTSGNANSIFVDPPTSGTDSVYSLALLPGASSVIDQGTASIATGVSRVYNGTNPDVGANEFFQHLNSTMTGTTIDINFGMNLNVPLLPSSGITGFTVACSGTGCGTPTVSSATRLSDSVIRLTVNHTACTVAQTWTWGYSAGNVTDSALIGNLKNQLLGTASSQPINTSSCGGTPPDPPAGLHIYYKFDEGAGTSANDETANSLDGTLIDGPTWTTGRTGNAVKFAANVQDYIASPYGNGINPSTQSLTIAFDVLTDGTSLTDTFTVFASPSGTDQRLQISSFSNTWSLGIQGSTPTTNTEFPISASWARLCLVMDSSTDTATLHVNGVAGTSAQSVKSYTSYTLAGNFDIGRRSGVTNVREFSVDNFKLWTSVESCADDYAAEYPQSPTSGTFSQVAYKFYLLRKNPSGAMIAIPTNTAVANTPVFVPVGSVVNLETQTNCDNVADCSPISQILQYEVNASGSWLPTSDNCTVKICFYGTSDVDSSIASGVPPCPLSGALTCVDGGTQRTASAIPNIDLGQNNSTVNRYVIQNNASVGDTIRFRLVNQNGEVFGTYSQYPTMNTIANLAGSAS